MKLPVHAARPGPAPEEQAALAEKTRAALLSVLSALLLTALKLGVGLFSNSLGVLAEAAHSSLDLLAAGLTLLAVRISVSPADSRHAYGHGKAENLAALLETLILLLTCGWIVREAAQRLLVAPEALRLNAWALLILFISIAVDFHRARLLRRVAKKHRSQALEADALHFATDMLSSGVVILGLLASGAAAFFPASSPAGRLLLRADALAALVVAVIAAWVSLRLGKQAVDALLDAHNEDHLALAEKAINSIPEVLGIKKLRLRESGPCVFIDAQLALPGGASLEYAHAITERVEKAVLAALPGADMTIHFEPEHAPDGELMAAVRQSARLHNLDIHAIQTYSDEAGEKTCVTLHASLPGDTSLQEAHSRVEAFEQSLRAPQREILTHLEPRPESGRGAMLTPSPELERQVRAVIDKSLEAEPLVTRRHSLRLLEQSGRPALILRCHMPGSTSVRACHESISRVERFIQRELPMFSLITIHADVAEEPEEAQP